jgi:hypothetical protein
MVSSKESNDAEKGPGREDPKETIRPAWRMMIRGATWGVFGASLTWIGGCEFN